MLKTLQMVFQNEAGKNVSISLADAKEGITPEEVKAFMQKLIDKNIIATTGGALKSIVSASIIDKSTAELSVK